MDRISRLSWLGRQVGPSGRIAILLLARDIMGGMGRICQRPVAQSLTIRGGSGTSRLG
jgi:hypothetical protein